jgi:hypothetical protein
MKYTRIALAIAGLAAFGTSITVPAAFADDTVSETVNGGSRTATLDTSMSAVEYSHDEQVQTGTMALTVDDCTGTGAGWYVTIQSSDFVYTGENNGTDIPASNFSITSAGVPQDLWGQAIDANFGPRLPFWESPLGSLDSARQVIEAQPQFGSGTYTQTLGVTLDIPAQARAGSYTATITTTISPSVPS